VLFSPGQNEEAINSFGLNKPKRKKKMPSTSLYMQCQSLGGGSLKDLHRSMQTKALLSDMKSFFTGHTRVLMDLDTIVSESRIHSQHYAGSRTVPINQIKGSEGRSDDFDCDFNPMHSRTIDRWVSIAVSRSFGVTLPLVELIQVGDTYYVRDGHHRISVARGFGEDYVDARIIVLELEPVSTSMLT
jgi:hypothetical protein